MAQQQLELVLDDVIDGEPVNPSSIPVGLLREFHGQVARFLKGGYAQVDLNAVRVSIEAGSYKVVPDLAIQHRARQRVRSYSLMDSIPRGSTTGRVHLHFRRPISPDKVWPLLLIFG